MSQGYELKQIPPKDIDFAVDNPRGEKPAEIAADPSFEQLKESVWKYGVLVPIVVHRKHTGKPYRLVDGERRLRAALLTKVPRIPAHIATSDSGFDELVQAFHIHMLRKQWKPVAQAKALKKITEELQAKGKPANEYDALEELRMETACSPTRFKALQRAIRFPEGVLKIVDDGKLSFSHLVQIEESFLEALAGKFPDLMKEIGEKHARQVLVTKAQQKTLTSTRALMECVLPVITRPDNDNEKAYAKQLLREFVLQVDMPAEKVLQQYEQRFPASGSNWSELGKDILDWSGMLRQLLERVDSEMMTKNAKLTKDVQEELLLLRTTLSKAIRRINRIEE